MPRYFCRWVWLSVLALAAACSRPDDRAAGTRAVDTTRATAPADTIPALLTVLYNQPQDTAAFEQYYRTTHLPLVVANQKEIRFTRADLTKFIRTVDGKKPTYYRQAELYFNSLDELKRGITSPGFKKVVDDLSKFATGGLTGMIAILSNQHPGGSEAKKPGAILTVIYKTPKNSAAFEKYYADTHLPLVMASKKAIGFEKAELTRFVSNLEGDPPARYRQGELYFSSIDALKKGLETRAFQKVAGDLGKFATGGLDALIGVETR
jgi:uncharacterized protein (TIGR02118 family)